MRENIIKMLRNEGIKLEKLIFIDGEKKQEEIYEIQDSEKLIFFVYLCETQRVDLEDYVNDIMNWISYKQSAREKDMVERYGKVTMRKILWDMYVIFACNNLKGGFSEDEIYTKQRNPHFMKRFIVQGDSENEIVEKIKFIIKPEDSIDKYINKLSFVNDEAQNCIKMCETKKGETFQFGLKGETYEEIIKLMDKINGEDYGEALNENTGSGY